MKAYCLALEKQAGNLIAEFRNIISRLKEIKEIWTGANWTAAEFDWPPKDELKNESSYKKSIEKLLAGSKS